MSHKYSKNMFWICFIERVPRKQVSVIKVSTYYNNTLHSVQWHYPHIIYNSNRVTGAEVMPLMYPCVASYTEALLDNDAVLFYIVTYEGAHHNILYGMT